MHGDVSSMGGTTNTEAGLITSDCNITFTDCDSEHCKYYGKPEDIVLHGLWIPETGNCI